MSNRWILAILFVLLILPAFIQAYDSGWMSVSKNINMGSDTRWDKDCQDLRTSYNWQAKDCTNEGRGFITVYNDHNPNITFVDNDRPYFVSLFNGSIFSWEFNLPEESGYYYLLIDGEYSGLAQPNEWANVWVSNDSGVTWSDKKTSNDLDKGGVRGWYSCYFPEPFDFVSGNTNWIKFGGPGGSIHLDAFAVRSEEPVGMEPCVPHENKLPTATLTAEPNQGTEPLTVTFHGGCSDPNHQAGYMLDTCKIDFGDGSWEVDFSDGITHTYSAGDFTAVLTATDKAGESASASVNIEVGPTNLPPTASLSANPTTGPAPLTVNFTFSCSDTENAFVYVSYYEETTKQRTRKLDASDLSLVDEGGYGGQGVAYGDGDLARSPAVACELQYGEGVTEEFYSTDGSAINETVSHTYDSEGVYTAILTATDSHGDTDEDRETITVSENKPPTADAGDDIAADVGDTITLHGTCYDEDGLINACIWSFDEAAYPQCSKSNIGYGVGVQTSDGSLDLRCDEPAIVPMTLTATDNEGATGKDYATVAFLPVGKACIISPSLAGVQVGETETFDLTCWDSGAEVDCPAMSWSSDDDAVAEVVSGDNESVLVRGVAEGSATIDATDGVDYTCQADVTVSTAPPVTKTCTISPSSVILQLNGSETFTVECRENSLKADCGTMNWSSDMGRMNPNSTTEPPNNASTLTAETVGDGYVKAQNAADPSIECQADVSVYSTGGIRIRSISANDAEPGETVTVDITVENTYSEAKDVDLWDLDVDTDLDFDSSNCSPQSVNIGAGETGNITCTIDVSSTAKEEVYSATAPIESEGAEVDSETVYFSIGKPSRELAVAELPLFFIPGIGLIVLIIVGFGKRK